MDRTWSRRMAVCVLLALLCQLLPPADRTQAARLNLEALTSAAPIGFAHTSTVASTVDTTRSIAAAEQQAEPGESLLSSFYTWATALLSSFDQSGALSEQQHETLAVSHESVADTKHISSVQPVQRSDPALASPAPRGKPTLPDSKKLTDLRRQAARDAGYAPNARTSSVAPAARPSTRLAKPQAASVKAASDCPMLVGAGAGSPTIAAAFEAAFAHAGGFDMLGCPLTEVIDWGGAPTQFFGNADLVYNGNTGVAYLIGPGYWQAYEDVGGASSFLGLPTQHSTDASAPPAYYRDYYSDFTGAPIQLFEHGFIGSNAGTMQAARHFPLACAVGVTVVQMWLPGQVTETQPNPPPIEKKKLSVRVGGLVDPGNLDSGDAFGSAVISLLNETSGAYIVEYMARDGDGFIYEVDQLFDPHDRVGFIADVYRQSDNFIGFAPQSTLTDGSDYEVPAGYGYFPLSSCSGATFPGGGSGGYTPPADTTPPVIGNPELEQDGAGNVAFTVKVTDNRAVASVTLTVDGQAYPLLPRGGDLYSAAVYGLQLGKHEFFITATDTSGNTARLPASGVFTFKIEYSGWFGKLEYQGYSPDPVNTLLGNYIYQYTDLKLVEPGPDLIVERFYNGQSSAAGLFGVGWTTLFDMRVKVMENLLLSGAQVRYPDGRTVNFPSDGAGFKRPPTVFDTLERAGSGYVLTRIDQTRYTFNNQGQLTKIEDLSGNAIVLTYSGTSPAQISAPSGRKLDLTSDGSGRITKVIAPGGVTLTYSYDGDGFLTGVTDGTGATVNYTYDAEHGLIDLQTPQGHDFLAEQTFDDQGRVTFQRVGDAFINRFSYDDAQRTTTLSDSYGNTITYRYDEQGRLIEQTDALGHSEHFAYNSDSQRTSYTDRNGQVTRYEYNAQGDLIKTINALGLVTTQEFDAQHHLLKVTDALGRVTRHEYDAQGRKTATINALGQRTTMGYNAQGQVIEQTSPRGSKTTYTYDAQGNLIAELNALGGVTRHEYDMQGRRIKTTDANGHSTTSVYDANGNLLQETDALGQTKTYTYDDNNNRVSETDANGHTTRYTYNHLDNLVQTTAPDGSVTTIVYDDLNHRIAETDAEGHTTRWVLDDTYRVISETNALSQTTRSSYDAQGNRVSVTDARGSTTRYEYDALNRVTKMTDALGGVTSYAYDAAGNRIRETNPNGATTEYTYDVLNRVIGEQNALGFTTAYAYDADGNRISVTDADGQTKRTEYDAVKRISKEIDALGHVTRYEYDAVGNRTVVIDALGHTTRFEYDAVNRKVKETNALRQVTRYKYDAVGNQTAMINALGHTTRFAYDALNRRVQLTDALNGTSKTTYDYEGQTLTETDANGHTTAYGYDALGHTVVVTNALGFTTRTTYDPVGNQSQVIDQNGGVTKYDYDALNRVVVETNALGFATRFSYDPVGNLLTKTDATQHVTRYTYDLLNRRTSETNALGFTTTYEYDRLDQRVRTIFADGSVTAQAYDPIGRLLTETDAEGFGKQYAYNAVGSQTVITDALGFVTTTEYDALRRPITVSDTIGLVQRTAYDPIGNVVATTDGNEHTTRMSYDALRRLTSQTDAEGFVARMAYDAVGNKTSVTNGNNHTTRYTYDARNQLIAETNPLGHTTRYGYDGVGNRVTSRDALGYVTRNTYDAAGQLVAVTLNADPARVASPSTNVTTRYEYDPVGNRTRIIDANNHRVTFTSDAIGQLLAETDPLGQVTRYVYNSVGRQVERRDPNGNVVRSLYDRNGSLVRTTYADRSTVKRTYDGNRNVIKLEDRTGVTERSYDARNRLIGEKTAQGRITYRYDGANNRTSLAYVDGKTLRYEYYANNQLRRVLNPDAATTTYIRDGVGQVTQQDSGNQTRTIQRYDAANQLLQVSTQQLTAGQHLLTRVTYTYNAVGQRTNVSSEYRTGQPKTVVEQFAYDPLRRVIGVTSSEGRQTTYRYDAVGNRVGWQTNDDPRTNKPKDALNLVYNYDAADQLTGWQDLSTRSETSYHYDANGNRLEARSGRTGTSYLYDAENRLLGVQEFQITGSGKRNDHALATMTYDGDGRRISKAEDHQAGGGGVQTTGYVYDGLDPIATYERWHTQYDNLYRADANRILTLDRHAGDNAGKNYWYTQDALGNTTSLSQDKGQGAHTYQYDIYGAIVPQTAGAFGPHNAFTFTGQEYDDFIGLYHFHARTYDPNTGTWLTRDPYRGTSDDPQSLHRYGYVKGNPVNLVDVYGYMATYGYPSAVEIDPTQFRACETEARAKDRFGPTETKLVERVCTMIVVEQGQGRLKSYSINAGSRTPAAAHRASTAWSIQHDTRGMLSNLQALEGGKDLDNNIWYQPEWLTWALDEAQAMRLIKLNALTIVFNDDEVAGAVNNATGWRSVVPGPSINYSREGYERGDPRRRPNKDDIPVSSHVYRKALDVSLVWNDFSEGPANWHPEVKKIIDNYGLFRPIPNENWHFELGPEKVMGDIMQNYA